MKFLIIQTAFIGDVILATALVEKLKAFYNTAQIDFFLRKGNESLLKNNPNVNKLYIFDKTENKYFNLRELIKEIRKERYDVTINVQRFATTGIITVLSRSKRTIGFDKNPFSFLFSKKIRHSFTHGKHEIERNQELIADITDHIPSKPRLYPTDEHYNQVAGYKQKKYLCIAPASAWSTKQFPFPKWIEFINQLDKDYTIYLLGGPDDIILCDMILAGAVHSNVHNLAGRLSLLASAALMQGAVMNYVNDSSPMHMASAVNAPTCAVFCSTIPGFGFGPLADKSFIVEIRENLYCRPCGIHGFENCPEGHFNCAKKIENSQLNSALE